MTAPTGAAAVAGAATLTALDSAYRAAIANTAVVVIRAMLADWSVVDVNDLAGTSEQWVASSVQRILAGQRNSSSLANVYASRVRSLVAPTASPFTPPPLQPPNAEQVRKSIVYTGLVQTAQEINRINANDAARRAAEPVDPSGFAPNPGEDDRVTTATKRKIMENAISRAAGSATRLITTSGRDQLVDFVQEDPVARGWVRTTKANCCYFCAMLASRGPVYKGDSFEASNAKFHGVGDQKVHDNCGCGLRPWYGQGEPLPERVEDFEKLWAETATGSGAVAIRNFRRAYEGRPTSRTT